MQSVLIGRLKVYGLENVNFYGAVEAMRVGNIG
jgi:hypothetical protein